MAATFHVSPQFRAIPCSRFLVSQGTAHHKHCVSVSLWNLYVLITTGQQVIVYYFFLFNYIHPHFLISLSITFAYFPLRRRCFPMGFHQSPLLQICVYLYNFPLWRRCFPSGFHQSPRLVHTVLLLGSAYREHADGFLFFGLVSCF